MSTPTSFVISKFVTNYLRNWKFCVPRIIGEQQTQLHVAVGVLSWYLIFFHLRRKGKG